MRPARRSSPISSCNNMRRSCTGEVLRSRPGEVLRSRPAVGAGRGKARRRAGSIALALVLAWFAVVSASAEALATTDGTSDKGVRKKKCYKCGETGKLETGTKMDPFFLYDSHLIRTDPTAAIGFTLCERTPLEEVRLEYENTKARNLKWLEKLEKFEEAVGSRCSAVEAENILVFVELQKMKVDGKKLSQAKATRRLTKYLSRIYDRYREVMGVEGVEKGAKHTIYVCKDQESFKKILRRDFGRGSDSSAGFKYTGREYRYVTRKGNETDEKLERRIIYSIGSLFIHKYHKPAELPPWLSIGFGSWLEHDTYGSNENFTFVEVPPDDAYKSGTDWRKRIKREATTGNIVQLVEIHDRDLNAFGYRDAAFAFSYIDFLVAHDRELFQKFIQKLKASKDPDSMKAILDVYGWLPAELNAAWRDWVMKKY